MTALPIEAVLPELRRALVSRRAVVLQAPPGAGKTTRVPLALLDEPWLAGRSILILEPRRLAARAAASRMSQLRGEAVGETVGYRIRFDAKVSKRTRIEVLTEGILTRRLQADPALEGVGLVIFDEFHERHLHADLALALCVDAQRGLREDLKILVMSATLDGEAVSRLLEGAPIVTSRGRSYPVDVVYAARDPDVPLPQAVAGAVTRALGAHEGDVLVFLPGAWEIRRTQELLERSLPRGDADVFPLYGDLPWEQQERAIRPIAGRRKIVLATPIAETSLTIEGVRVVIDSGFARVPQFDPNSGLTRLVTQRISRANAEQRAGRAGRLAPGACYRLWSEGTQRGLIAQPVPEIRSADLAPLALELAAWGVADAATLAWLDPPPAGALAQARALLVDLDALTAAGRITAVGRAMAALPVHPRLAHMLAQAGSAGRTALACDIAALLSERDVLSQAARRSCDLTERLEALTAFRHRGRAGAQAHQADANACARVDQAARQLRRLVGCEKTDVSIAADDIGTLLAAAYPDRIAQQRVPGDVAYLLSSGRGARLPHGETRLRPAYLVAANLAAGETEGVIHMAASITVQALRDSCATHISAVEVVRWDSQQQAVIARREQRLGELLLDSRPLARADPEQLRGAMLDGVRGLGLEALPWTPELRQWQARVLSLRAWCPQEPLPDVSDTQLLATLDSWLGPYLDGVTRRDHLARIDLSAALKGLLDWNQAQRLEEGAPTHLTVPSGSRLRIDYAPAEAPVLAVKLQEMFGCADTPRVGWTRAAMTRW